MRPAGDIYLDLEVLYDELVETHGMQMGDLMYWLYGHLKIHRPDCVEEYVLDGTSPEFKYGPIPNKESIKKKLLKILKESDSCSADSQLANDIIELFNRESK